MIATAHCINFLEANNPLTDEEDEALREAIRGVYRDQVHCWVLLQSKARRRRFFELLAAKPRGKKRISRTADARPIVVRSSSGSIDIRAAIYGRNTSRRIDPDRFASKGIKGQQIFGSPAKPVAEKSKPEEDSMARFILKRFWYPDVAPKMFGVADDYLPMLMEIQEWIDKKCNAAPIKENDEEVDELSPYTEASMNKSLNDEDHVTRPMSAMPVSSPLPCSRAAHAEWRTPPTMYTSFFGDRKGAKVCSPCPPIDLPRPFCSFPETDGIGIRPQTTNATLRRQAEMNRTTRQDTRRVFESRTFI